VGLEATARIELAIRVLQTPALPLGYVAPVSDLIVPGPRLVREWRGGWRPRFYEALITRQCYRPTTGRGANPISGNSLFALVLLHTPPMFALLWTQRCLRHRLAVPWNLVRPLRDTPSPATGSLLVPSPRD
jgi:hypothetical protein